MSCLQVHMLYPRMQHVGGSAQYAAVHSDPYLQQFGDTKDALPVSQD